MLFTETLPSVVRLQIVRPLIKMGIFTEYFYSASALGMCNVNSILTVINHFRFLPVYKDPFGKKNIASTVAL